MSYFRQVPGWTIENEGLKCFCNCFTSWTWDMGKHELTNGTGDVVQHVCVDCGPCNGEREDDETDEGMDAGALGNCESEEMETGDENEAEDMGLFMIASD